MKIYHDVENVQFTTRCYVLLPGKAFIAGKTLKHPLGKQGFIGDGAENERNESENDSFLFFYSKVLHLRLQNTLRNNSARKKNHEKTTSPKKKKNGAASQMWCTQNGAAS